MFQIWVVYVLHTFQIVEICKDETDARRGADERNEEYKTHPAYSGFGYRESSLIEVLNYLLNLRR